MFCSLFVILLFAACGGTPPTGSGVPPTAVPPTAVPPIPDLTGVWQADYGDTYYIRQLGTAIMWAGLSSDDGVSYTNVFCATLSGATIAGSWADVPRGNNIGTGTMSLEVDLSDPNNVRLVKTSTNDGFGPAHWHRLSLSPSFPSASPNPRRSQPGSVDVTGTWGVPGGTTFPTALGFQGLYYIRQVGGSVWWVGMSNDNGRAYTNVYCGSRSENDTSGNWADIPRGSRSGHGTLTVSAMSTAGVDTLTTVSQTGGFGPTQWDRIV
jgi:hypothetical protein